MKDPCIMAIQALPLVLDDRHPLSYYNEKRPLYYTADKPGGNSADSTEDHTAENNPAELLQRRLVEMLQAVLVTILQTNWLIYCIQAPQHCGAGKG
jgi:hypothetical protein